MFFILTAATVERFVTVKMFFSVTVTAPVGEERISWSPLPMGEARIDYKQPNRLLIVDREATLTNDKKTRHLHIRDDGSSPIAVPLLLAPNHGAHLRHSAARLAAALRHPITEVIRSSLTALTG
jgi:hypothetical protein